MRDYDCIAADISILIHVQSKYGNAVKNWQETSRLFNRLVELDGIGRKAALAVIVRIRGSTYRRPGAKLLVEEDGSIKGNVSGGCLENNVLEESMEVMRTSHSRIAHYDTGNDEDKVWGMGMGCNGEIDLLISAFPSKTVYGFLSEAIDHLNGNTPFAISTVVEEGGDIIAAAVVSEKISRFFGDPSGELRTRLEEMSRAALNDKDSLMERSDGMILFAEVLLPPPCMLVCGAGDDAISLVRVAADAGFRVVVADHRRAYLKQDRFPEAWRRLCIAPEDESVDLPVFSDTYAVVKTHSIVHDVAWMKRLSALPIFYIGLLGPRDRRDEVIKQAGEVDLKRIYGPAGLDLGGDGPEHIALSIVAEALCVWSGRRPVHLRERTEAIHENQ